MKEFDKPADQLLEAIKQWYKRKDGVDLDSKQLLKEATNVIKSRLA